jgi:hypothetical protein
MSQKRFSVSIMFLKVFDPQAMENLKITSTRLVERQSKTFRLKALRDETLEIAKVFFRIK